MGSIWCAFMRISLLDECKCATFYGGACTTLFIDPFVPDLTLRKYVTVSAIFIFCTLSHHLRASHPKIRNSAMRLQLENSSRLG